ncbi:MAG: NAD(P)-dependent oxidoreductase [Bacteroidales bacterium]|jgi:UDP-glucose 4-epimerase|nr:NAD(P)-dependent oxidoreductase [Bacteroidales bacterium]
MNILLTGGTGFIGSYVAMQLLAENHNVTILARNANKVPAFHTMPRVQVLEIGMTDYEKITQLLQTHAFDACVHVALNYNDTSAYDMLMSDTAASIYLASECAKYGVTHFIYTSSTAANDSVYDNPSPKLLNNTNAHVCTWSKHDPHSYYGATKAATENFLWGITGVTGMRVNVIRPGYTFGNPVIEGAYTQPDRRFHEIAKNIRQGKDIEIIKNDGTQFIWAGDLAKIYTALLNRTYNKHTYFGLSNCFTSWLDIVREAKQLCNSKSNIIVKDLGWSDQPIMFDVSDIQRDFGFSFSPYPHITQHIEYLLTL